MNYVEKFDFVTLTETLDNCFDMSGVFCACDDIKCVSPAVKLYQGRRSGGVMVMVKKNKLQ